MQASVIIPVKNDSKRLHRCLESIYRSSIPVEVVVIDNGSTDDSVSVARSSGAIVSVEPNLNIGALRNRGVALSQGDVLAFVDSDHEVPQDWIASGLRLLESEATAVAVGAPCLPPEDGTWVQRVWAIHRLRGPVRSETQWLGSGNLMVRRSSFLQVSGFREDLVATEDVDLCYRLKAAGGRIIQDKAIRNVHHGEPRTVWEFTKKEYFRGSSGLKSWFAQGFPARDIPNLIWPLWFGGVGTAWLSMFILMLSGLVVRFFGLMPEVTAYAIRAPERYSITLIGLLFLWFTPALLLSIKVCWSENKIGSVLRLALLYALFGIARFAAIVRGR